MLDGTNDGSFGPFFPETFYEYLCSFGVPDAIDQVAFPSRLVSCLVEFPIAAMPRLVRSLRPFGISASSLTAA